MRHFTILFSRHACPGGGVDLDIAYANPSTGPRRWVDIAVVPPASEDVARIRAAAARDGVTARREVCVKEHRPEQLRLTRRPCLRI